MTKTFELVFFDGELLFHNGRNFSLYARFYGYDSEIEIFTDIVEKRESLYSSIYEKLFEELDLSGSDDEYITFCEKPEIEQAMTFYEHSKISWRKGKINAFTLLDVSEKLYEILKHFEQMECYWRSNKIKEYRKVVE